MNELRIDLRVAPCPDLFHTLVAHGRARAQAGVPEWWVGSLELDRRLVARATRGQRQLWDGAVGAFAQLADRDVLFDDDLRAMGALAHAGAPGVRSQQAPPWAAHLDAIAEVTRAHRDHLWAAHRAAGESWRAAWRESGAPLFPEVSRHAAELLGVRWPDTVVPVDVVTYGHPVGAYTASDPARITVAAGHPLLVGSVALEVLVHEAVHTVDQVLADAVREAEAVTGVVAPGALWHIVVFVAAAHSTAAFVPGHVPYAHRVGLFDRPGWERAREVEEWSRQRADLPLLARLPELLRRFARPGN